MLLGVVQHGGQRVMQVEGWRRMAVKRRETEEDGCEEERGWITHEQDTCSGGRTGSRHRSSSSKARAVERWTDCSVKTPSF